MLTDLEIRALLEAIPCYVLYNTETLIPVSTSGSEYAVVPEGYLHAIISYVDHEAQIHGNLKLSNYFMKVEDGIGKFTPFESLTCPTVYIGTSDTIKDLAPSAKLFNYLGIPFVLKNDMVFITYDVSDEVKKYFDNRVKGTALKYKIYVTEHSDPMQLYETHDFNLSELYKKRIIEFKLNKNYERVSLWATK